MEFTREELEIIGQLVEWNLYIVNEKISQFGEDDENLTEHYNKVLSLYKKIKGM